MEWREDTPIPGAQKTLCTIVKADILSNAINNIRKLMIHVRGLIIR